MEQKTQQNGLMNLLVLLVMAVVGFVAARYGHSWSGQMSSVFLFLGFLAAAVSYFQMRLEERERLEQLEFEEMKRVASGSALFEGQEADTFPARRSREQFERVFVPGFTILLFLLQAAGAWILWGRLGSEGRVGLTQPTIVLSILGFSGLMLFLVGKYAAGLVRMERQRLLGAGASYLLLGAYLYFLTAASVVVVLSGAGAGVDVWLARGLCILLMLLAMETLLTLLLEIYRPRVTGKAGRVLYESRLVGLLSHPEGLITTAAQALDYQFGFKVSETWFYRFMERALAWLILAQLGLLVLSTSFVFIQAGEEALLERFGRPITGRGVAGPGLHLKLPWPIDRAHRFRTRELQTLEVGLKHEEEEEEHEEPKTVLWTVRHAQEEFHLLVASRGATNTAGSEQAGGKKQPPVNLLSASIPVQYQINDLNKWAYNYGDAGRLLEQVASGEVVKYLVSVDFQEVMSTGREKAAEDLRENIQARADELELGARIVFVGLPDIHPPLAVAASYEAVVGARQKREAVLLEAQAHRIRTNALASAESVRRRRVAEGERARMEVTARADAVVFTNQLPAFQASPNVYAQRAYLRALSRGSTEARKVVIVATNTQDVITLDLEEKLSTSFLESFQSSTQGK